MPPRYKQFYEQVVRADLLSKMQYKNFHQIPTVKQISVSGATRAANRSTAARRSSCGRPSTSGRRRAT